MAVDQVSARPFQALTSAPQQDASGLREGSQIDGRVIAVNSDDSLRVATRYGIFDVDAARVALIGGGRAKGLALTDLIGSSVRLEVTSSGQTSGRLNVRLIAGGETSQSTTSEAGTAKATTNTEVRIATDLSQAAACQDGLAPVFATAQAIAAAAGELPDEVTEALAALASHGLDGTLRITAADIRKAVSSSGLFLEAHLFQLMLDPTPGQDVRLNPVASLAHQDLKAALFGLKSALESWTTAVSGAPQSLSGQNAHERLETSAKALVGGPTVSSASRAAQSPATFDAEALFAVLRPPPVAAPSSAASPQMTTGALTQFGESALTGAAGRTDLVTMAALSAWFQASGQTLPGSGGSRNAYGGRVFSQELAKSTLGSSESGASSRPPPPRRGSLPHGQSAYSKIGLSELPQIDLAHDLVQRIVNALARVTLCQYASLPEQMTAMLHGAAFMPGDQSQIGSETSWLFEIPIHIDGATSIAQFEIDQVFDGGAGTQQRGIAWRLQFCVDLAPLGPVHARLLLADRRLSVGLWAEDVLTGTVLHRGLPSLRRALEAADFVIDEIHFAPGRPPSGPPARAGGFVDRNA